MKVRKTKEIKKVLNEKGFELDPKKHHHEFYFLKIDGKKHNVYTYFSHGKREYNSQLMSQIKKQLKFTDSKTAEDFFDCPFTKEMYFDMIKEKM